MTPHTPSYDYGECELCDTPLEERDVTQDFWIRGELVVIDHVRAGVCPQCGAKVVNQEVGEQLLGLFEHPEYVTAVPRISVPVVMFDEYVERYVHA